MTLLMNLDKLTLAQSRVIGNWYKVKLAYKQWLDTTGHLKF